MGNTFIGPTEYPVPIANTGTAAEDDQGRLIYDIAFNFQLNCGYLGFVIQTIINTFSPTARQVAHYLSKSELFSAAHKQLLERGLIAYLEHDYMVAVHMLIPQIESAVRHLLERQGEMPLRISKRDDGAFQLMTFDQVLSHELIQRAFGDNRQLYFRVLFTDPRGWNLRNHVSHGMVTDITLDSVKADRVFHALLTLGLIRWKEAPPSISESMATDSPA
jgi:hypothetical protein